MLFKFIQFFHSEPATHKVVIMLPWYLLAEHKNPLVEGLLHYYLFMFCSDTNNGLAQQTVKSAIETPLRNWSTRLPTSDLEPIHMQ